MWNRRTDSQKKEISVVEPLLTRGSTTGSTGSTGLGSTGSTGQVPQQGASIIKYFSKPQIKYLLSIFNAVSIN